MTLPTRTWTFIKGDHTFPWESDWEDDDHRFYELSYGAKVYLNFNYQRLYPSNVIQSEGTFIDGYKAGIWRFFNENGVLSQFGSYNKKNERHGKWRFYEEFLGRPALKMVVDQRENSEHYWSYDMRGNLWQEYKVLNTDRDFDDHVHVEILYKPTDFLWPGYRDRLNIMRCRRH